MTAPQFLIFTPVPLRARNDGWSPELQLTFIRMLAAGARPGQAAQALGKNRQNAYALRNRPGANSFRAAWDTAVAAARAARTATRATKIRPGFSSPGDVNLQHLSRKPVAFRAAPLRPGA